MSVQTGTQGRWGRLAPGRVWDRFVTWMSAAPRGTISFSLLRILFAMGMLILLVPSWPDRHYLWGAGSWWVDPEASRRGWWEPLMLVFSKTSAFWFDMAYGVLLLLVVLFLIGYRTRWVTPLLLVFWVALSINSTLLVNAGDTVMRIVLFFAIFADLSAHFSVDAWRRRRRAARGLAPRPRPRWVSRWLPHWLEGGWLGNWAHNTVLILCCYQLLLIYSVSSLLKLSGQDWLGGTAIYYALSIDEFHVLPMLSAAVIWATPAILFGSWLTLATQLLFPVLVLWRPTRYITILVLTGMHLGIAVLLGLWPFSLAMIGLDLLLVRDASWRKAATWVMARVTAQGSSRRTS